jgi:uncharacterized membrane protein YoaK (UPF0700 family)
MEVLPIAGFICVGFIVGAICGAAVTLAIVNESLSSLLGGSEQKGKRCA